MKKRFIVLLLCLIGENAMSQGFYNHVWLLGSYNFLQNLKGRMIFDSTSYVHTTENRKMPFKGTEATICDAQGNFLMSTNGIWIANANNDTMLNGSGLNPNGITGNWAFGLPMIANAIFLPFPGDSNRFVLFHHTADLIGSNYKTLELLYSEINIQLDNSLGGVVLKNQIVLQDTLAGGITACKHANGRDWWVVMIEDSSDIVYRMLLSPSGIQSISTAPLGIDFAFGVDIQISFSQDGTKFICSKTDGGVIKEHFVRVLDFDRCSGTFSNPRVFDVSGSIGWGLAFSPSGRFAYACSSNNIYQFDLDSLTIDTVATYDGFISPPGSSCCATSFWNMYLAANGKIYITSGSSVQHLHEMNYPDSAGVACDVQQHALDLGSYLHLRAVPNHPNYNLGPVIGSVCDTLSVGLAEPAHDFHFSISPNPVSDGVVKLTYLLPQNKAGVLEVFDLTGQRVYSQQLPPWSTLQFVQLPEMSSGLYTCVIRSGNEKTAKKLVVMR